MEKLKISKIFASSNRLLNTFILLTLEGIFCIFLILSFEPDPKNSWLLGFSIARWILVLVTLFGTGIFAYVSFHIRRPGELGSKIIGFLDSGFSDNTALFRNGSVALLVFCFIGLVYWRLAPEHLQPTLLRVSPSLLFTFLIGLHFLYLVQTSAQESPGKIDRRKEELIIESEYSSIISSLAILSIFYLSLPIFIFAFAWMFWPYATLTFILLSISIATIWERLKPDLLATRAELVIFFNNFRNEISFLVVILIAWILVSGIGGVGLQTDDWMKHNAVLVDLGMQEWPVTIEIDRETTPIIYYVAYYLPASIVGKLTGSWLWLNVSLMLWTYFGLLLAVLWFLVHTKKFAIFTIIFFIFFSGLDVLGYFANLLFSYSGTNLKILKASHLEFWAREFQYSSNTTLLFWVPQHAIGGWIAAGLLLWFSRKSHFIEHFILIFGITMLWSPFVSAGSLIFLLGEIVYQRRKFHLSRLGQIIPLAGLWLTMVVGLYYYSLFGRKYISYGPDIFGITLLNPIKHFEPSTDIIFFYLFFVIFEVGFIGIIVWKYRDIMDQREKILFLVSISVLVILPIFRVGKYNDLVMRSSIPILFFIATIYARVFSRIKMRSFTFFAVITIFIASSITPLFEIKRHLTGPQKMYFSLQSRDFQSILNLEDLAKTDPLISQYYFGQEESFFNRVISRP